ncbi:hypothetical protein DB30_04052 [Enhygromyxa salina]|uniref:Uncharacterized protein n=1 Tax=Enhygromyxa salina TaxID=215803 RepID=A0A0C2D5A5_9BACT|nr:hypothetical protein DB30_04052 [Enhygromyxa salina]
MGELVLGGLTWATLRARVWRVPANEVPRQPPEFRAWLAKQWLAVDAFIQDQDQPLGEPTLVSA